MTAITLPAHTTRPATTKTFAATAIHDGLLAGFRAKEALGWLDHVLAPEFKVRTMSWSFRQLERLDVRSMALRATASAQMIIVAGCEDTLIPAHVERWLDDCVSEAVARPLILVALPDDESLGLPGGHESQFVHAIRQFAARWHADFMSGAEFDQKITPDFVHQRFFPPQVSSPRLPAGRHALESDIVPRFYGIND